MNDSENRTDGPPEETNTERGADVEQEIENEGPGDRLIGGSDVLEKELPRDLQELLGRVLDEEPVETVGDWVARVRRFTGGKAIDVDDLCHADRETGHWGRINGERYHFLCFYDAVVLSALAEDPVDIRTESPGGTVITAQAAGTSDLTVAPEDAVFSFGIDDAVEAPADGRPSPADIYAAVCPYVRAFPNQDAYERWARDVSAATVAMPLAGATDLAAALVE